MRSKLARALLATAALAPLGAFGCESKAPAAFNQPNAAAATPIMDASVGGAGASGIVSSVGGVTAGGVSGALSAGAAAAVGGMGGAFAGALAAAGAGGAVAAPCRVSDTIMLTDDDADGGVAPDCHDVPRTIITENCIGYCHHNRGAPSGGLNLQSPCVADRLIDVTSQCEGLMFVDSKDPERSFLLDKLEHMMPRCGKSMPDGWHLPPNQVKCMNAWVHAIVRAYNGKP